MIKHMRHGADYFLAIAQPDQNESLILKWNGVGFSLFQKIPSCNARDFATINTRTAAGEVLLSKTQYSMFYRKMKRLRYSKEIAAVVKDAEFDTLYSMMKFVC